MLPSNGGSNLKSRLTALFRRSSINDDIDTLITHERFLTHTEAAQILQSFMPNKDAFAWLEVDRNVDPSIPFFLQNDEVYYRYEDIKAFIRHLTKSMLNHKDHPPVLTKVFVDRRSNDDRRDMEFYFANSERRVQIDRRSGFERREESDRRKIKDDFGYGRSGDRRSARSKDIV